MNSILIFVLIILALLVCIYFVSKRICKTVVTDSVPTVEPMNRNLIISKTANRKLKKKVLSDNEQRNYHKALLKARRQGHLTFFFHEEYYPTGLMVTNGGK